MGGTLDVSGEGNMQGWREGAGGRCALRGALMTTWGMQKDALVSLSWFCKDDRGHRGWRHPNPHGHMRMLDVEELGVLGHLSDGDEGGCDGAQGD